MKKLIGVVIFCLSLMTSVVWADVDYQIIGYQGDLTIHEDNSADFIQTITYDFDSSYNGQIVSLGTAGMMPAGFAIDAQPTIEAYTNDQEQTVTPVVTDLGDGYEVKIYNGGLSGDVVKLVLHWRLTNLLFVFSDVAELNWVPISDWDQTLHNVRLTVKMDGEAQPSQLWAHTGYLRPQAQVTKIDQGYQIDLDRVASKLEVHAYWPANVITTEQGTGERRLIIIDQEKSIADRTRLLRLLFFIGLPLLIVLLLLWAIWLYYQARRSLNRYARLNKESRLYEMPADMEPLLVAQYFYNRSLKDFSPVGKARDYGSRLSFERLIQASLLDMIDRKALTVQGQGETASLVILSQDKLSDFERSLLSMAFGKQTALPIKQLFSDYSMDKDIVKNYKKKYRGAELERQLNHAGNRFESKLQGKLTEISQQVKAKIDKGQWPANYRSLTVQESKRLYRASMLAALGLVASLAAGVALLVMAGTWTEANWFYLALFLASLATMLIGDRKNHAYREVGVLTADGQSRVQEWTSFTNMMRDIKKFDRVDMAGLIVWNRMLVYATLFGYAKQVEEYMAINDIRLADPSLFVVHNQIGFLIGYQTSQLVSASQTASSASNFSVSSGGSSGGGFSGGGGGGGGGAF